MTEFTATMSNARKSAATWAKGLKIKDAFVNVFSFPFYAIGRVFGYLWFVIKFLIGLIIVGFQKGANP